MTRFPERDGFDPPDAGALEDDTPCECGHEYREHYHNACGGGGMDLEERFECHCHEFTMQDNGLYYDEALEEKWKR